MVLEEGKFYPIMKVCPGSPYTLTKEEACYGKELLSQRHPVLQSFLHRELDMKRKVLRELDDKVVIIFAREEKHCRRRLHV